MSILTDFIGGSIISTDVFKTSYVNTVDEISMLLADRANMSNGAAEPFIDAGDVTLVNASISSGYVANNTTPGNDCIPTMTAATTDGWTASASSTYPSWNPYDAFSKILASATSAWDSNASLPQWLRISAPAARKVRGYALTGHVSYVALNPTGWQFQGSTDGSSWVTLDTKSAQSLGAGARNVYTLSTVVEYQHYRWYITSGGDGTQVVIDAAELLSPIALASTVTLSSVTISGATSGRIVFRGQNIDATGLLDVGNSSSNKIEVYPMINGVAGSALSFTTEDLGNNIYRYTSEEFSLASATSFGVRFQSFARSVAPNFRITNCYWIWR